MTKIKQSKILTCDSVSAWNREERAEKAEDDAEEATISSSDIHVTHSKN